MSEIVALRFSIMPINEYTAANYDSYQDNYGEYEDWIEIYNMTASAIDINGYYLSDKVLNPTKWQVPSSYYPGRSGKTYILFWKR